MIIKRPKKDLMEVRVDDAVLYFRPFQGKMGLQLFDAHKRGNEAVADFIFGLIEKQTGIVDEDGVEYKPHELLSALDSDSIGDVIAGFNEALDKAKENDAKKKNSIGSMTDA